jgi:hypothetical protein
MLLGHFCESAYVYNKITKVEFGIFKFDNDPVCGLVGGDVLVLKAWFDNTLLLIGDLKDIHQLRLINEYSVHILTDPWTEESANCQLELDLNRLTRSKSYLK